MIQPTMNAYTIGKAGQSLGQWLIHQAHKKARVIGFGYAPAQDAPDTFDGVKAAYRHSMMRREAFPVWSGGSDCTIYGSAEANYAFRYLHDTAHVEVNGDFTFEGESKVALSAFRPVLQAFGDSLESRVYLADSLGQVHYHAQTGGQFPEDQAAFVTCVILRGQGLGIHGFLQALPGLVAQYLNAYRPALAH